MKHQKIQRPIIPEQHWLKEPTAQEWRRKYYNALNWALAGWVGVIVLAAEFLLLVQVLKQSKP